MKVGVLCGEAGSRKLSVCLSVSLSVKRGAEGFGGSGMQKGLRLRAATVLRFMGLWGFRTCAAEKRSG